VAVLGADGLKLSALLNSTSDVYSKLSGAALVKAKVAELVVMGGDYPSGYEFNFLADNPVETAHVVNSWPGGDVVFSGDELGRRVRSGAGLMMHGPASDPVRAAYMYYTYNTSRFSWDPLTVLYAIGGLGDIFTYGNLFGYNHVEANGSNYWVHDEKVTNQHWLYLKTDNETAASILDRLFLDGAALAGVGNSSTFVDVGLHHQA